MIKRGLIHIVAVLWILLIGSMCAPLYCVGIILQWLGYRFASAGLHLSSIIYGIAVSVSAKLSSTNK